jgi:hypothetical protein
MIVSKSIDVAVTIATVIGGLALVLPGEKPAPPERLPAIQATIEAELAPACVSIECQVCPAEDYFSTRDKEFCMALGWNYGWTSSGWRPDHIPEAYYARNPSVIRSGDN